MPPSDIQVPMVAAARLVIESRFDLLPHLFRAPSIIAQHEVLPISQKAVTSSAVHGEGLGFEMRGATAFLDSLMISPANEPSPPGTTADTMDKHAVAASDDVSSSDLTLDGDSLEHNLVEDEGELFEELGSNNDLEQESEVHLQGVGGGAVVVGCSADADTADMLHALSQSLKTSNLKASVQTGSPFRTVKQTSAAISFRMQ
jgi:hypothetical protein